MQRVSVAFRAFFAALFNADAAKKLAETLAGQGAPVSAGKSRPAPQPKLQPTPQSAAPSRSDAITLLSALQREARFVDLVQESLEGASDEQVGAVVRDVHRGCAAVLARMFALRPLLTDDEGAKVEVPAGFDSARFRLVGNVEGQPPYQGNLAHHGWIASQCELPTWSGQQASALVISPADIELK